MRLEHAELIEWLAHRLQQALPGRAAQLTMAPLGREDDHSILSVEGKTAREAATLVLLYPFDNGPDPALVLTVRQPSLRDHSGQISFPGGRRDGGETAEETALREGYEEVGIDPAQPRVLGRLSPLYIPPSRFSVYPVVAAMHERPPFVAQEAEVAALLEVPLHQLLDPATRRSAVRAVRGGTFEVPYYDLDGYEVWGATAMMLAEFLAVVREF
jgi:8-oxo-dGTP pyrophosphatase MutT (NUDIX family)